jgi:hypothetical protein
MNPQFLILWACFWLIELANGNVSRPHLPSPETPSDRVLQAQEIRVNRFQEYFQTVQEGYRTMSRWIEIHHIERNNMHCGIVPSRTEIECLVGYFQNSQLSIYHFASPRDTNPKRIEHIYLGPQTELCITFEDRTLFCTSQFPQIRMYNIPQLLHPNLSNLVMEGPWLTGKYNNRYVASIKSDGMIAWHKSRSPYYPRTTIPRHWLSSSSALSDHRCIVDPIKNQVYCRWSRGNRWHPVLATNGIEGWIVTITVKEGRKVNITTNLGRTYETGDYWYRNFSLISTGPPTTSLLNRIQTTVL